MSETVFSRLVICAFQTFDLYVPRCLKVGDIRLLLPSKRLTLQHIIDSASTNMNNKNSLYFKSSAAIVFSVLSMLLFVLPLQVSAQSDDDFRSRAGALVECGELKKAEKLLSRLPAQEKRTNAVAIDSIERTIKRIRRDFSLDPAKGREQLEKRLGHAATDAQIDYWKSKRYIETATIDGKEMWFRRGVGNFFLLNREDFSAAIEREKKGTHDYYMRFLNEAMQTPVGAHNLRNPHRWQITFTLTVAPDAIPDGDTLHVWLPYPMETVRQTDVKLVRSSAPMTVSKGTVHTTAYMEGVAHKGEPTKFTATYSFTTAEQYFSRAEILSKLKPYDTSSETYKKYTAEERPHIMKTAKMRELAQRIVGDEKNPVLQASMIYDWIASSFLWAGAREYSTIANIPEYVLREGHGDCGQVSLLYITLVRSLGIPARWESGFMLHPGATNYHDWAETYFEGVGWVPTDASFGRDMVGEDHADYYKTGIDLYRFVVNRGVNGEFNPKKKFIRSETVDNQAGEVEWKGGNLEYTDWSSELHVDSCVKIDLGKPEKEWGMTKLSVASMRTHGNHAAEMATQSTMGTPLKMLHRDDDWYEVETPDGYHSYIPGSSIVMLDSVELAAWRHKKRYIVTAYQSRLTSAPGGDETVSDLVMGDILEYRSTRGKAVELATPDGRKGYADAADVEDLGEWAAKPFSTAKVITTAKRMMGSPYFWGGTSTKMTDCSGLSKVSYFSSGVILRRDAWQQALTGTKLAAGDWKDARAGDLFFFGTRSGRVTHVAISLGGGRYIHCSGRVKINSVDPKADDYLSTPFLSISRIDGNIGTDGITAVKEHPWYF